MKTLTKDIFDFDLVSNTLAPELLQSSHIKTAHIELTTRCNLLCTYCAVSQPEYKGIDMAANSIDAIIADLQTIPVGHILLNGHGETTMIDGWETVAEQILALSGKLKLISNFAKRFSKSEIATLARFEVIEISIDSFDDKVLPLVRRKVKPQRIIENMYRVRAYAVRKQLSPPQFAFSCVVHNLNCESLAEYAALSVAHGVKSIDFCNLTKYPDIEGAKNVYHVAELPIEHIRACYDGLKKALFILDNAGVSYELQDGLVSSIEKALVKNG